MNGYAPSYLRLAERVLLDAMYKAEAGNVDDMLWLVGDDAKYYLEILDIERVKILRFVAVILLGHLLLPNPEKPLQMIPIPRKLDGTFRQGES